jgi:hypothetical protein
MECTKQLVQATPPMQFVEDFPRAAFKIKDTSFF